MAKKHGIYANGLPVPQKAKADKNPYPGPIIGLDVFTQVPRLEPRLGGFSSAHGYGHAPKSRPGHLRTSGSPKAHRIGKR